MTIKVPLKLFIGIVDQQLLKTVGIELLEAINIEHTDETGIELGLTGNAQTRREAINRVTSLTAVKGRGNRFIDAPHEPKEQTRVSHLSQSIALILGLGHVLGLVNSLASDGEELRQHCLLHFILIEAQ